MNKTAILVVLTILTLLVACAPKAAPAAPEAAPAASEAPPAPEAAPAESAPAPEAAPASTAPSDDPVIVGKLTAEQRADLTNNLATVAATAGMAGQKIKDLQTYVSGKNQAMVAPLNTLRKLFDESAVMLATVQGQASAGDESLDENTVKLREQMDGLIVLVSQTENVASQSNDETLFDMMDSMAEDIGQMNQDYKFGYIAALEQFTNADLETNPYYTSTESNTDTALTTGYAIQKSDLDGVEAASQEGMFAPEGEQPAQ